MSILAARCRINHQAPSGPWYDALFASGEDGLIIDFNDLTTLFQDAAHTVPVTAVGQSIQAVQDKKNPSTFATCATGNTLGFDSATGLYYCQYNGLAPMTMAINSSLGGNLSKSMILACDLTAVSTQKYPVNLGDDGVSSSLFLDFGSSGTSPSFGQGGAGQSTNPSFNNSSPKGVNIGLKNADVLSYYFDGSVNGAALTASTANITSLVATIGGYPYPGYNLTGNIYNFVVVNRVLTSGEIASVSMDAL